jgi:alcohol dehydrogenase class IV
MPKKIIFAPGCFDDLDLSQEELDALVEDVIRSVEDDTFEENSRPLDEEEVEELIKIMDRKHTRQ